MPEELDYAFTGGAEEDEIDQCPFRLTITLRTWTQPLAENAWENISEFLGNSPAEVLIEGHSIEKIESVRQKYYILGIDDIWHDGDEILGDDWHPIHPDYWGHNVRNGQICRRKVP